jgi:hypothetical protein
MYDFENETAELRFIYIDIVGINRNAMKIQFKNRSNFILRNVISAELNFIRILEKF